jgi:hypothetical protein
MGFRMRKSIKVAPGVRVNVSKRGVGASVGGKGARYSVHSSGRRTVSAGSGVIPGVYYQKSRSGKGSSQAGSPASAPAAAPVAPKKPGMFAPKGEKQIRRDHARRDHRHSRDRPDGCLELLDRLDRRPHWPRCVRWIRSRKVVLRVSWGGTAPRPEGHC